MLSALFELEADVADAREYLSLHVVSNADMDGVVGVKSVDIDGEIVLVATDALSLGDAILVDQVALHGVYLDYLVHLLFLVWVDGLLYDERQPHEGIGAIDAQAQLLLIIARCRERWYLERQGVVFLPSCDGCMAIRIVNQRLLAGCENREGSYY